MTVLTYAAICVMPALTFKLAAEALDRWTTHTARRRPAAGTGARARARPDPFRDLAIELDGYGRTLRRLTAEHRRVLTGDLPAKAARLRAVQLAYDDTLRQACRALDIDAPPSPLDPVARIQTEADLAVHGLAW
jgi:hypothetical protein